MSKTETCIGGMVNGWYAVLNFRDAQAEVFDRDEKNKAVGPIAFIPFGLYEDETEEEYGTLDPEDSQNKFIMAVLAIPDMILALQHVERVLEEKGDLPTPEYDMLRSVQDAIEKATTVPK